jgi:hypothetical protein
VAPSTEAAEPAGSDRDDVPAPLAVTAVGLLAQVGRRVITIGMRSRS